MTALSLSDVAERIQAVIEGDSTLCVGGVAGLREALPGDISFLANPKYADYVAATKATAVIVPADYNGAAPCALLRAANPDAAFAQVATWFTPPAPTYPRGIHPSAIVDATAHIGANVCVGPGCVIEPDAVIGDGTTLIAQVYVGHGSRIGGDNLVYPHVTIREGVQTGARVIVHSSSVLGSDGFGYSVDAEGIRTKIPQRGRVEIGDDVEIGAAVAIDRARFGRTVIGNGVKIDNLVQIAHNVVIGDHAVIVSQVGISGSTVIGRHAILAGQTGVAGHLVVGDGVIAEGRSGITKDVPAGQMVYGYPAAPREQAARLHAHIQRLPKLKQKVADLEARIAALESSAAG